MAWPTLARPIVAIGLAAGVGWPGQAGGPEAAVMASAKASSTWGLVAVSREAAMTPGAAPERPLLKCRATPCARLAANQASANFAWLAGLSSEAGSHAEA